MKKEELRIVFLGNPDFALHHLQRLIEEGFNVVGVVSAPDRPAGRGMKLRSTPVGQYAKDHNIPLLQPKNLKSEDFQDELQALKADIQVVIAFRMLPVAVWDMPPMGTVNIHASLLPQYRGAAPINWAIINGETKTGVTSFKLKHQIDTGDILLQRSCEISSTDTAGSLHDKLMYLGADTIVDTLHGLLDESITEKPQAEFEEAELKYAPKIFTEDCEIDWNKSALNIYNMVRGLSPYPVAFFIHNDLRFKLYSCDHQKLDHNEDIGSLNTDNKTFAHIYCSDGYIILEELQMQGKQRMDIQTFLRGYNF